MGGIAHSLGLNVMDDYFIAHQGFYTTDESRNEVYHKMLLKPLKIKIVQE